LTANVLIRFAVGNNRVNYPLWPAAGQQIAIANDIDYVFCRENQFYNARCSKGFYDGTNEMRATRSRLDFCTFAAVYEG